MVSPSIVQDAALAKKLKTIPVNEIQLGMVVHAIAEQTGSLGVKSKGRVADLNIIEQLSANGVISVVVEPSQAPKISAFDKLKKQHRAAKAQPKMRLKNSDMGIVSNEKRVPNQDNEVAFAQAAEVLDKCHAIHKQFSDSIAKSLDIDFTPVDDMVAGIFDSMLKHPSAMLCLSMLMNDSDYLAAHSVHVATLLCYFANYLGLPRADCERLTRVGYLFDIGMLKIPKSIRNKKGALEPEEFNEVQNHVAHSLKLLEKLELDNESLLAIEQHHERLDGSGYPNAYNSDNIHKFSRMLAIVDSFDAMTALRNNKTALSPTAALKVLSNPDYAYDQKLVYDFIRCVGIYPVGSLLALSNNHIALVMKTNRDTPLAPVVKVFYSISGGHFIKPKIINLDSELNRAAKNKSLRVIKPVLASQYGLDINKII